MKTKIKYSKSPLSFQEQLEKLERRGLIIANRDQALAALSCISYYRLSAYWLPFKERKHSGQITENFQKGTEFNQVIELYEFDRQLRLLINDAIERIEISIRTTITYHLSHKYGAFTLNDAKNFHPKFDHTTWLTEITKEILRSREPFIEHYKEKYLEYPTLPVWMATEVSSFGSLSLLYKGLKNEDKGEISKNYNLHYKALGNWLHFLTYIRNICAHHSRLWNKEFAIKPKLEGLTPEWLPPITPRNDRCFFALLILKHLLNHSKSANTWLKSCENLINPVLEKHEWSRHSMGIVEYWERHPLWIV